MSFYWVKTNLFIRKIFPNYIWLLPNKKKEIYLTFDDGPIPEITEWVLDLLEEHKAKATFFCIGDNIRKNPTIFNKIIAKEHSIGNHTFNHLNGWKTTTQNYFKNTLECQETVNSATKQSVKLFRPPYGKIKSNQAKKLKLLGYKIIMWDVLSGDFDNKISKEKCLKNVIQNIESGSIIVFHDSIKASNNLKYALPKVLTYLKQNNYSCAKIDATTFR